MNELCFVGLGSNLGDSKKSLNAALEAMQSIEGLSDLHCSSFYGSKPHGPQDQPDYVNAVAKFNTTLSAYRLLKCLQGIENQQGRVREGKRWGARTLDLDILLYGHHFINTKDLIIPHLHLFTRPFVLYPMYEIAPDLIFPNGKPLSEYIETKINDDLWILE